MTSAFLEILNRSISAGYLVLAILVLRRVFRRIPKWVTVLLWGFVAFRLLCPVDIESSVSLIPSAQTIPADITTNPAIHTGISSVDLLADPILEASVNPVASADPIQILVAVSCQIWLLGMLLMALYTAVSYFRLRRRVAAADRQEGCIYQSEAVGAPFLLGLFSPHIYLPMGISQQERAYVIAHEMTHLRRRDHWWKPLGFALLTLTWFHPLMWIAYILLCRDIELACDEAAVKKMEPLQRAEYSQTLLNLSIPRRQIAACPLAFGEVGVKERVKRVLYYQKPAFWVLAVCLVLCVVIAVAFLTVPSQRGLELLHGLTEEDVRTIHSCTITPETEVLGTTFYSPDDQNVHRILPVLNQAKAVPISRRWGAREDALVRFITIFLEPSRWETKGKYIKVEILNNRYLIVEDYWYEADEAWLQQLPPDKSYYSWLTTLREEEIEKVEFLPEPGSDVQEVSTAQLVAFMNEMHIPAQGYPDELPALRATYRITTVDGVTRELFILGSQYLKVEDVLYDVSGGMENLTKAW